MDKPTVSVIIVNYYVEEHIIRSVDSVLADANVSEIIIVDNGSATPRLSMLQQEQSNIRLIAPGRNIGFAAAANLGASASKGEFLFFLNPDAIVVPGSIGHLIDGYHANPGIIGPTIHVASNNSSDLGATMNHFGMSLSLTGDRSPLYVSGCALLTSKALFETLGGFDDRYFLFVEDVELCWRALIAGFQVSVVPEAEVLHEGGASAEGGYFEPGKRYSTSALRITLRARNTFALMVSCAPWYWLIGVLPALMAQSLLLALGALLLGRPNLSWGLLRGIVWNINELPTSMARRASITRSDGGCRNGVRRFVHKPIMLSMILKSGVPKVMAESFR